MTNAYLCYLVVTCDYYFLLYMMGVIPLHLCMEKVINWSLKFETRRQGGHLQNMVAFINLKTNLLHFNGKRCVTNIYLLICKDCNNFGF